MLAAAAVLLSPALLPSCAASRTAKSRTQTGTQTEVQTEVQAGTQTGTQTEVQDSSRPGNFVPLHPPVVVNKTWREAMEESKKQGR